MKVKVIMKNKVIETTNAKVWLREDGITQAVYEPNSRDTLITAKENIAVNKKLHEGKKKPILIDYRNIKSQDKAARDYFASDEVAEIDSAIAILIDSGFSKVIGNFYMGLNKPKAPTKLFTSEENAIEWLKGYLHT